jgi:hypothetical protein
MEYVGRGLTEFCKDPHLVRYLQCVQVRRKFGRRRLRWLRDVENNLPEMKMKRWMQKLNNRVE